MTFGYFTQTVPGFVVKSGVGKVILTFLVPPSSISVNVGEVIGPVGLVPVKSWTYVSSIFDLFATSNGKVVMTCVIFFP